MPSSVPTATTRRSTPRRSPARRGRIRLAIASLGLLLGPLAIVAPADAAADDAVRTPIERQAEADRALHPAPADGVDADRRIEVLKMKCRAAKPAPDATRIRLGCRWRAANHPDAVGYQLWRIVDRGERELVARGGLDLLGARDVVSAKASVVRYAVIAVDERGHRVGQSRVQKVVLRDGDGPRVDPAGIDGRQIR